MIGTLVKVHDLQEHGQTGYYGAILELSPDCSVTPYLIQTWAILVLAGLLRGDHLRHEKETLPETKKPNSRQIITTIFLYLKNICGVTRPKARQVKAAILHYFNRTGKYLFGSASCNRIRSP